MEEKNTKENYTKKYNSIISSIKNMSIHDGEDNPWYSDDYHCSGFEELKKTFPNVSFEKSDFFTLQKFWTNKSNNDKTIFDLEDSSYGYSFYETHGHRKTAEETKQYNKAKEDKENLDSKWENAIFSFFNTCEILNGNKDLNSCDIEKDAFQTILDYNLKLRPKNPLYNSYFNTFEKYNEAKSNNEKLLLSNRDLNHKLDEEINKNKNLNETKSSLEKKVSSLQKMLSKTLEFCNHVKESRFGKFFFRKQIKALPSGEIENDNKEEKNERER